MPLWSGCMDAEPCIEPAELSPLSHALVRSSDWNNVKLLHVGKWSKERRDDHGKLGSNLT